jgi:biotin synthase
VKLSREEILAWLCETDEARLNNLWQQADETRRQYVGDEVHLRGLIEYSNYCRMNCTYCGIRAGNTGIVRYRMTQDEILSCARQAASFGYGTVVIQGGEDSRTSPQWMADVISQIKAETNLAVTLSLGEQPLESLNLWRESGADRYLLRFETSDLELYSRIRLLNAHQSASRIEMIQSIKSLGFETGSGIMVGIPGQRFETIVKDLELFTKLDLDMVGIGPYLPHPETPLGVAHAKTKRTTCITPNAFVPNTADMALRVLALTRLLIPTINIPSTTAITTLGGSAARISGLSRGANVIMPNMTPAKYSRLYEIYPKKAGSNREPSESDQAIKSLLSLLGRPIGKGEGGRRPAA